jgi:hypothetical protein
MKTGGDAETQRKVQMMARTPFGSVRERRNAGGAATRGSLRMTMLLVMKGGNQGTNFRTAGWGGRVEMGEVNLKDVA